MVLIIAISYTLTPYVGPSNEDPILTNEKTGANLTAVMWADPQFSNYLVERTRYFDAACEDVTYNIDGKVDAIVNAGDIAENGLLCEYQYISEKLAGARTNCFINAVGNHDVRLKASYKKTVRNFTGFTNELNKSVGSDFTIDCFIIHMRSTATDSLFSEQTEQSLRSPISARHSSAGLMHSLLRLQRQASPSSL